MVIGTDGTCSFLFNYHTITITTPPEIKKFLIDILLIVVFFAPLVVIKGHVTENLWQVLYFMKGNSKHIVIIFPINFNETRSHPTFTSLHAENHIQLLCLFFHLPTNLPGRSNHPCIDNILTCRGFVTRRVSLVERYYLPFRSTWVLTRFLLGFALLDLCFSM